MKQKLLSLVFFLLFVGVFGYFYGDEYREFYEQKIEQSSQEVFVQDSISSFSLEDISEIQETQFFITPNKDLLNTIVQKIDSAERRVYLEVYIFTEKRVFEALKKAQKKGIDVQVILEKNPYMAPKLNNKRFTELQKSSISTVWSNPKNYSLNHSKFLIIDNEVILSTGNMSYSTFTKNRDFFYFLMIRNF